MIDLIVAVEINNQVGDNVRILANWIIHRFHRPNVGQLDGNGADQRGGLSRYIYFHSHTQNECDILFTNRFNRIIQ